ncbi:MAG: enoyl-CoA hydratase/isomerase family protein [Deltaproteobacteria bacterium]|nr:enoyl-CoA hydratase/isomerase family protein [Deltaproteobacteria bacterium]
MPKSKKEIKLDLVKLQVQHAVAEIRLNRPDLLNPFNIELATQLGVALQKVSSDKKIRAVILRGAGKAFSAGGDLKMFHSLLPRADKGFQKVSSLLNQAILLIRQMPKPVIAGIHGPAFAAGFGLTLACDLILASESARLSASFINIALTPNGSASLYLPRLVGFHRANELFFTGKVLSAQEAFEWGIVNRVVKEEEFDQALMDCAQELATRPTRTLAQMKRLMNKSLGISIPAQLTLEKNTIAWSSTTKDFAEGVTAFVEKRKAEFKGD